MSVMSEAAYSSTYMTRSSEEGMHPSGWALFPTVTRAQTHFFRVTLQAPAPVLLSGNLFCGSLWPHDRQNATLTAYARPERQLLVWWQAQWSRHYAAPCASSKAEYAL